MKAFQNQLGRRDKVRRSAPFSIATHFGNLDKRPNGTHFFQGSQGGISFGDLQTVPQIEPLNDAPGFSQR